jgi:hypothetical protein
VPGAGIAARPRCPAPKRGRTLSFCRASTLPPLTWACGGQGEGVGVRRRGRCGARGGAQRAAARRGGRAPAAAAGPRPHGATLSEDSRCRKPAARGPGAGPRSPKRGTLATPGLACAFSTACGRPDARFLSTAGLGCRLAEGCSAAGAGAPGSAA